MPNKSHPHLSILTVVFQRDSPLSDSQKFADRDVLAFGVLFLCDDLRLRQVVLAIGSFHYLVCGGDFLVLEVPLAVDFDGDGFRGFTICQFQLVLAGQLLYSTS